MRMEDPYPTFSYLVTEIRRLYPRFAYLHAIGPRTDTIDDSGLAAKDSVDFLRMIWNPSTGVKENGSLFISAGAYDRQLALQVAEETGDLIAFGRPFIANVGHLLGSLYRYVYSYYAARSSSSDS